jgi:hypothetical protein
MFLVPQPGSNQWRLIIDLRELNRYCSKFNTAMETLKHLRHLSRPGDYFVSLASRLPSDGLVRLGILLLQAHTGLYESHASAPASYAGIYTGSAPVKTFSPERSMAWYTTPPLHGRLPFLADSHHDALLLRQRVEAMLDSLGLQRNPKKGIWTPT